MSAAMDWAPFLSTEYLEEIYSAPDTRWMRELPFRIVKNLALYMWLTETSFQAAIPDTEPENWDIEVLLNPAPAFVPGFNQLQLQLQPLIPPPPPPPDSLIPNAA
jgi:hypothetical protein